MRVTTSQLRQIVVSPSRFVARARVPQPDASQFGNPQRTWMEAAWRAYFGGGRISDALWDAFERKVGSGNLTARRTALAEGAVPMLERFLQWDEEEAGAPHLLYPPSRDMDWGPHVLSLKRDAVYLTIDGYLVRLFWTDRDLTVRHPDASLMAAGVLAYSEADLGPGRVKRVEAWQLRDGHRLGWDRPDLVKEAARLQQRMDDVAAALAP